MGVVSSGRLLLMLALSLAGSAIAVSSVSAGGALASSHRAAGHPACNKRTAGRAVWRTRLGRAMRRSGASPPGFSVFAVYCGHGLTGAGRADMVALFTCCTSGAPTPLAIFRPERGRWRLSYSSFKPLIDRLSFGRHRLIEERSDYDRGDPMCCPDRYIYWSVRWDGSDWRGRRIRSVINSSGP